MTDTALGSQKAFMRRRSWRVGIRLASCRRVALQVALGAINRIAEATPKAVEGAVDSFECEEIDSGALFTITLKESVESASSTRLRQPFPDSSGQDRDSNPIQRNTGSTAKNSSCMGAWPINLQDQFNCYRQGIT